YGPRDDPIPPNAAGANDPPLGAEHPDTSLTDAQFCGRLGHGGDLLATAGDPQRLNEPRHAIGSLVPYRIQRPQQPRGVQLTNLRLDRHSAGERKFVVRAPHPLAYGHALGQGVDVNGNIVWAVRLILDALDDWHHCRDVDDGFIAVAVRPDRDGADFVPEGLRDLEDGVYERHGDPSSVQVDAVLLADLVGQFVEQLNERPVVVDGRVSVL